LEKSDCRYLGCIKKINKNAVKLPKIALEEAIIWPTQKTDTNDIEPLEFIINIGKGNDKYNRLLDINDVRLKEMKENNVICQIISPTATGLQNFNLNSIKEQAAKAVEINNYMYNKIADYPDKLRAFATLPMRYPKEAAKELDRCVKKLHMLGALVNGADVFNKKSIFYDTPEYDVLWKKAVELDVPIYFHPAVYTTVNDEINDPNIIDFYNKYPVLSASAWGFSINLAQHILRLMLSGVFDRFPKLKIIIGHMGELLPWWAERFDHRVCVYKQEVKQISKKNFKKNKLPLFSIPKLTLTEYLRKNIYVTTSGWFSDDALKYVIKKVGIDRVLFSIDYPYEKQNVACEWMDNVDLSLEDKEKISYKNAQKLFK
jgi:2,3-dihydroxybenzoate decarboxylase